MHTSEPGARRADALLGAAVIAMGLMAGLVFDWAATIMPALTAADDRTLVVAVQHTLDNPVFPLLFTVAGGLTIAAFVSARRHGTPEAVRWIGAGVACYAVVIVVTGAVHVPLNEDLKAAGTADVATARDDFAGPWVAWNVVRALGSIAGFACLAWALVRNSAGRAPFPGYALGDATSPTDRHRGAGAGRAGAGRVG